ncbi:hypothetical protein IEQ34_022236 [Dendrobium chrysotoxum]|uniref:Uncharacterized protein n=1 Tax=Dendrobium chrysotoxum TaxID=161865 RepID=A0AAV7FWP0_DENCH|nr:hypothetical protein IEQ34_022236 [Dendrobium chrysotoxum]
MHGNGKLKSLQGLDGFYGKNEIGYKIGELEHMNEINLLQNVKDAEEAYSAKLCAERRNFTNSRSVDLTENMLDNLQPSKMSKESEHKK